MDLLDRLVGEARQREPEPMTGRERTVAGAMALGFLVVATAIGLLMPANRETDPLVSILLVLSFAAVWRVRFELGTITAGAEQLVTVCMLFLCPLPMVPLLQACGLLLGRVPDFVTRRTHVDRWILAFNDAWPAFGPVVVLGLFAPGAPRLELIEIYMLAFAAQVAVSVATWALVDRIQYGLTTWAAVRQTLWAWRLDALLSPVALVIAVVAVEEPLAVMSIFPLISLLGIFSRERKQRYAAALELNQAYRGTVMVLADVVEAEDDYTAEHCRSVVELAIAAADELGVNEEQRQELEIAALLHDVGKIAIPKEILNKPAALTDEEFEVMKTHTVEGQALLDRVGGLLGRVGEVVRSCHERWDGAGYPDGLMGEEIPFAARIVFCCDAYSAMTTDRPYRRAMSSDAALEELRRNSGTQFDPRAVAALCKVVRSGAEHAGETYTDAVRAVLAGHSLSAAAELEVSA